MRPSLISGSLSLVHQMAKTAFMYTAAAGSFFLGHRSQIIAQYDGERPLEEAKRLAIFVHFDRRGKVHDFVVYYLQALRSAGFDLVFVSNSPRLESSAVERLRPLCTVILRRRNRGYDFGAYKDALSFVGDLSRLDEVILANDSVYGPLTDLRSVLLRCDQTKAAVWGGTDSWDNRYHLQSYFLLFKKEALAHPAFAEFWRDVRYVPSKEWVIRKYEIGLTQAMVRNGLRCKALFSYRQAASALTRAVLKDGLLSRKDLPERHRRYISDLFVAIERGVPLNVTHCFWDYLITELGCPFIKRELILLNPARVPFVNQWETVLRTATRYDPDLILRHLEMQARGRAN